MGAWVAECPRPFEQNSTFRKRWLHTIFNVHRALRHTVVTLALQARGSHRGYGLEIRRFLADLPSRLRSNGTSGASGRYIDRLVGNRSSRLWRRA